MKTSMAPGSQVVTDYYEKAGLWPYLEKLGFHLVGYGCTTCIGNSGPLPEEISARRSTTHDLAVVVGAVRQPQLRGPHQPRRQDELPGVAAAGDRLRAGRHDGLRLRDRAAGHRTPTATTSSCKRHLAVAEGRSQTTIASAINQEMFTKDYADVFEGDERWRNLPTPEGKTFDVGRRVDLRAQAPVLRRHDRRSPTPVTDITGARVLAKLGDSVTTDHISPAGAIKAGHPGRRSTSTSTAWTARTSTPTARGAATTR